MYDVVGIAMEVYNTLGRGLSEAIYHEAMLKEASLKDFDFESEKKLLLTYKGITLDKTYCADLYYKGIIIELKSVSEVTSDHRAQLFNYLRITHHDRGILFNFFEPNLHTERYLYDDVSDDFILLTHSNYKQYITDNHTTYN